MSHVLVIFLDYSGMFWKGHVTRFARDKHYITKF